MRMVGKILSLSITLLLGSCMKWDYGIEETFDTSTGPGVFILNEGNFQYGNATLSYYETKREKVENEVFLRANGMKLGDVAQSMTAGNDGRGWIAVNNSHVVFAIDMNTFKEKGRIENAGQPRYVEILDDGKMYISQIWDNRIYVADTSTYQVSGYITVPGMSASSGSTEQMVRIGRYVYCNCWSYQNRIIKIDTECDKVVGSLTVGSQPNSIIADSDSNLWVLTDGGDPTQISSTENATLTRINPETLQPELILSFTTGNRPTRLCVNGSGTKIYWISGGVWEMNIHDMSLPSSPIIPDRNTLYYGLAVDPVSGDIYLADAIDYQQPGIVRRYSSEGELINEFYVGITPGNFCFKP